MGYMMDIHTLFLWLHVLGVVAWIGGIIYILAVLLPNMPKVALRDRANFVPPLLRRFLAVVWTSVVIILVTGFYRIFVLWNAASPEFWTTPNGRLLMEKLGLVVLILGVVLSITFRAVPAAISHVGSHAADSPDAYKCPQCAKYIGAIKLHLQIGLGLALVIILWGVRLSA